MSKIRIPRKTRSKKLIPRRKLVAKNKRQPSSPRSIEEYLAKPRRFQNLWDRVVSVISKMRSQGTSLQKASQEMEVSPRTVLRYAGTALRKGRRGRYQAKKNDTLLRVLPLPGPDGTREVAVRGSRQASILGHYWNAVQAYLETGDKSRLAKFK